MQFYALIEEWPDECMAFFRELPGCYCSAPTYQEMVKAVPGAVADYLKWVKVVAKEGGAGPRFEADLAPPDDIEIDKALNVAATARAALLELYEQVSPERQRRRLAPDSWSLTEHMLHLLESEGWYVSRLSEQPIEPTIDANADIAMIFFDHAMDYELILRGLSPEQRSQVFTHDGAEWTAAKVLRRMTEHLREHYPWMVEIAKEVKQ
ncbi:MAG: DinB family protein [Chloroflexi bacterium]|nr:MAG: DinB family protein [Chloroflexota bacterium]